MNASRALLAMVLLLSGCSSCQRGEESAAGGGGGAKSPPSAMPATPSGAKIQVAPPGPVDAMRKPNAPGEAGGAPPAGEAAPAAPRAAEAPPQSEDCVVVADVNPDFGPPPLSVAFTAEAECGPGATYKWDFGDGTPPSTETNPAHTYTKDGDYTASVTVTGPNGVTAADELDIFVEQD